MGELFSFDMEISIAGKLECSNRTLYTQREIDELSWVGDGFVFVQYLPQDIFIGDVFILADGTEITLQEIKIQFNTKEPLTTIEHGWKCLCRFDNLNLDDVPAVKDWFVGESIIVARKKQL